MDILKNKADKIRFKFKSQYKYKPILSEIISIIIIYLFVLVVYLAFWLFNKDTNEILWVGAIVSVCLGVCITWGINYLVKPDNKIYVTNDINEITGTNEIDGGNCDDVNKYLSSRAFDNSVCDLNSKYNNTTGRYIKLKESLKYHPDKNANCKDKALDVFIDINDKCNKFVNSTSSYQSNNTPSYSSPTSPNATPTNTYTPPKTQTREPSINFKTASDSTIRDYASVGNQDALRELANRQPIKHVYTKTPERTDTNFCAIM